jgi:excisionase family DNA binding protein
MAAIDLITADELAQRLAVKRSTINSWVKLGIIPRIMINNKTIRFSWERVQAALHRLEEEESEVV